MPNAFKNATVKSVLADTVYDVCQAPAAGTAVIFGLLFSNLDGTTPILIDVFVYDDSTATQVQIGESLPVPIGSTLDFGKVSLEANDKVQFRCNVANGAQAFSNILEIT